MAETVVVCIDVGVASIKCLVVVAVIDKVLHSVFISCSRMDQR